MRFVTNGLLILFSLQAGNSTVSDLKDQTESSLERNEKTAKKANLKEVVTLASPIDSKSLEKVSRKRKLSPTEDYPMTKSSNTSNTRSTSTPPTMGSSTETSSARKQRKTASTPSSLLSVKERSDMTSPQSCKAMGKASPLRGQDFNSCNLNPSRKRRRSEDDAKLTMESSMESADDSRLKEFDVNSMPSARLLSEQEKRLCSYLRLTPSQYISIKGLMIKVSTFDCLLNS